MLLPVMSSSNKVEKEQEKIRIRHQAWSFSCSNEGFFHWDLQRFLVISALLFPAQFCTSCAMTAHCTWKWLLDKAWQLLSSWNTVFWVFFKQKDFCQANFSWCRRKWEVDANGRWKKCCNTAHMLMGNIRYRSSSGGASRQKTGDLYSGKQVLSAHLQSGIRWSALAALPTYMVVKVHMVVWIDTVN